MPLLSIQPELLDEIITYTLPNSFESFLLSCKTVYHVGKHRVRAHNTYKRRWKHFSYDNASPDVPNLRVPLELLLAIAENPIVAGYMETADFWHRTLNENDAIAHTERVVKNSESMAAIEGLLRGSNYLAMAKQDPGAWLENLHCDDDRCLQVTSGTVMLLTLLPNLKSLTLPPEWAKLPAPYARDYPSGDARVATELWNVLDIISREAASPMASGSSLGKLERVLPHAKASYDERNGLREVGAFMPMKSLQELYVCNGIAVDDNFTGIPFEWRYPDTACNLRKIELAACCINSDGITELIRHTPQLAVLKYSHDTKWHGCEHDWSAGEFVAAIEEHRGDTLTELAVTIDSLFGEIETGVTAMHGFQRLEKVELDVRVFAGPAPGSGERQGLGGTAQNKWSISDLPCLAGILPASVKDVNLSATRGTGGAADATMISIVGCLLRAFTPKQQALLPNLRTLDLRSDKGKLQWKATKKEFREGAGVEGIQQLCRKHLFTSDTGERRPLWREAFHERFGV